MDAGWLRVLGNLGEGTEWHELQEGEPYGRRAQDGDRWLG